jgi:hypothetical protein
VCAPHQRILACENLTEEREDNMRRENFLFLFFSSLKKLCRFLKLGSSQDKKKKVHIFE